MIGILGTPTESSFTNSTTETTGNVLNNGSRRKAIMICTHEGSSITFGTPLYNGNAMTVLESPARFSNALINSWYYDIDDGLTPGSKNFSITPSATTLAGHMHCYVLEDATTGAAEDSGNDTAAASDAVMSVVLTNASTSFLLTGFCNEAGTSTHALTGSGTERSETVVNSAYTTGWGDGGASGNDTMTWTATVATQDKIMIAIAIAEDLGSPSNAGMLRRKRASAQSY